MTITVVQVAAEQKVNNTTSGDQKNASLTALSGGGWVVTWESNAQDGSGYGIFQRKYNADGSTLGQDIQVNTFTLGDQTLPNVTALPDGGWVVTWTSNEQDGSLLGVYQQRYSAAGAPVGSEVKVNATTSGSQSNPAAAGLPGGGWVVAWQSPDASGNGIFYRVYDASGATTGADIAVNVTTALAQSAVSVAALKDSPSDATDGGFVITWQSSGADGFEIYQRRYSAAGVAGTEVQVNTTTGSDQSTPFVTGLVDGGWVVTWTSFGQDGSGDTIVQRRYDKAGAAVGGEVVVNVSKTLAQNEPSVTALSNGGWVVTWQSPDANGTGIYQRVYNAAGQTSGPDQPVNTATLSTQAQAVVTATVDGGWVVAWQSVNQDGSGLGVYQKQYYPISGQALTTSQDYASGDASADTLTVTAGTLNGNDVLDGGEGVDTIQYNGTLDWTVGASVTNFEALKGGAGDDTLVISAAQLGALTLSIDGSGGTGDKLQVTGGGALDLTGKTIANVESIELTSSAGTAVTVNAASKSLALLLKGNASSSDQVTLQGAGFTAAEKAALFQAGIETIIDANGTFVNEPPTDLALSGTTVVENAANNTVVGTVTVTDASSNDTHTLSLEEGAAGRFKLVGNQIQVANGTLLNFEGAASHVITVKVTDQAGGSYTEQFTINLTNVNEAPTDIGLAGTSVAENATNGTQIGTLSATDPDAGDTFKYALVNNAGGRFDVQSGKLVVSNGALLDFEGQASHTIVVEVTDKGGTGLTFQKQFTVTLTNVNEAPTNVTLSGSGTVAENAAANTVVGNLAGIDPEGSTTLTLTNDAGGRFKIVGNQLQVANGTLLDFEGGQISHTITVRATDAQGLSFDKQITIAVTNANDAPTDIALAGGSIIQNAPNNATVATLSSTDPDPGDTATYFLLDDAGGLFKVAGNQIQVANSAALNAAGPKQYTVTVQATDVGGKDYQEQFTINVTTSNVAPNDIALAGSTVTENAANDVVVGTLSSTDPDAGDTATYSLVDNAGGRFKIVGNQIQVANSTLLNFDAAASHTIIVKVTDSKGGEYQEQFTITLTNVNEAPTNIGLTATTVVENPAANAVVGTLTMADPDAGDTATFTLTDDAGGRFKIAGNQLQVANPALLDFEAATSHVVTVKVTDAGGLTFDKQFTITLTNVNEAPANLAFTGGTIAESAAANSVVGTLSSTDPDAGDTSTYSLLDNAGGRFKIVGNQVQVANAALLDFEGAASHTIIVRVTDAAGAFTDKSFTVNLTNVNEAPTNVTLSGSGTVTENAVNNTVVGTLAGVDPDAGPAPTLSLIDDAGGRFKLVGNQLQVANGALLDFDASTTHTITVRATDAAGLTFDKQITVTLTNVNEAPTNITLTGGTVAENATVNTAVATLTGIDPDAAGAATFSLVDNAGGRFAISGNQIVVASGASLNFEAAASHDVVVKVTDPGGLSFNKTFTINLTNVNETPTNVTLTGGTIAEGAANDAVVGTLAGADPDSGDTLTFSLTDNAGGRFKIVGNQLQVANGAALDFDTAASHTVKVQATDAGGLAFEKSFTVTLTNVNEGPTNITLSGGTVAEGAAINTVAATFTGVDPDTGDTLSYALLNNAGGRFSLNGNQLVVANPALLNFEAAASHDVIVQISDSGGLTHQKTFTINLSNVNEGPTAIDLTNASIAENAGPNAVVGTLTGTDPDGETLTFTLVDNAGGRFGVIGNQLVVANPALLDYDTATSHNIVVKVTDAAGLSFQKSIAVSVTNVNEAPATLTLDTNTIVENAATGTIVGQLTATDPDSGDTLTYSLANDAGGRFKINGTLLEVADGTLLNYEGSQSHTIAVKVTDANGLSLTKTFTVNVTNTNEAPTGLNLAGSFVVKGAAQNTLVGTLAGVDADTGSTFTYTLLDDAGGRFVLVNNQLRVSNGGLLDSAPATHSVKVQVADQAGLTHEKVFTINVGTVNQAPTDIALGTNTVVENAGANTIVGTLTGTDPNPGDNLTFTLADDAGGRFKVVGNQIVVANGALLNYEAAKTYNVVVQATDTNNLSFNKSIAISLTDINEAPTALDLQGSFVVQGAPTSTVVGTLTGTDLDANSTLTYTLLNNAGGRFGIVGNQLVVVNGTLLTKDTAHLVEVQVSDQGGLTYKKTFTINVGAENLPPVGVTLLNGTVAEQAATDTVVGTLVGTDPNTGDGLTFSLVDNVGGRFKIVGNQILVANGALIDYETNTSHKVSVKVTDTGGLSVTKEVTVNVTNINEGPVNLNLNGSFVVQKAPTGALVGTLKGVDPDAGETFTYTLLDDAGGRFQLVGDKLQVKNGTLIDINAAVVHDVKVRVTDSSGISFDKIFTINVGTVNDSPVDISFSTDTVAENSTVVGTLSGLDPNPGDFLTYSLTDNALFTVSGNQIVVKQGAVLDYEAAKSHTVQVKATDTGGKIVTKTFIFNVTDVNEAPTDAALSTPTVVEKAVANTVVGTLTGTDPDAGDSVSFTLVDDADGAFKLGANNQILVNDTNELGAVGATHTIIVRVTDEDGLTHDKEIAITVAAGNGAPTDVTLTASTIAENAAVNAAIGTLTGVDPDGDALTYTLVDNAGGRFKLGANGQLQVANGALLNYEAATAHDIKVKVTDADGLSVEKVLTVDLTNVNERPTDIALSNAAVRELSATNTLVGTLAGLDPDKPETFTYKLLENAGGRIKLVGNQLLVDNGVALDYEQPGQYKAPSVKVLVTDKGGLTFEKTFTLSVTNWGTEQTKGSSLADVVYGGSGRDKLSGGSGKDILKGGSNADTLSGGTGDDRLWGGLGKDVLSGNTGKDVFVFDTKLSKTTNVDTLKDYNVRDDSVWLENKIFTKIGRAGTEKKPLKLSSDAFHAGKAAADAEDRIVYDKGTGALYYDRDGTGAAAAVKFATLKKGLSLTHHDFFVI